MNPRSRFCGVRATSCSVKLAGSIGWLNVTSNAESGGKVPVNAGDVAVTGLYFLLPIVILIWCIIIERLSPALSAFCLVMEAISSREAPVSSMDEAWSEAPSAKEWLEESTTPDVIAT